MPAKPKRVKSSSRKMKTVTFKPKKQYNVHNGPWANTGANIGGAVGGALGGPIGQVAGGWIGRRLFHYPAKYIGGSGDYRLSDQSFVSSGSHNRISPPIPKFSMDKEGVCISHTEYIGDIITSSNVGALKIQKFAVNPSEQATFPWLSTIAQQSFQQYKFEGCAFQFKSYSADALNSTNTALGAFFSCINYDFTDDDFTTRSQIENVSWAQSCKPSDDVLIPVECKPSNTSLNGYLYVNNGFGTPSDADPRLYNLGKLFIGTTGFQGASVNIGSLYVTYKIRLYKPIIPAPLSGAHFVNIMRTATAPSNPFGTGFNTQPRSCDTIGVSFDTAGTVMTLNRARLTAGQRFLVMLVWYGTAAAITHPTITNTGWGRTTGFNTWSADTLYVPNNTLNSSISSMTMEYEVNGGNDPVTITLNNLGVYPTAGWMEVYIVQRNGQDSLNIGISPPI